MQHLKQKHTWLNVKWKRTIRWLKISQNNLQGKIPLLKYNKRFNNLTQFFQGESIFTRAYKIHTTGPRERNRSQH